MKNLKLGIITGVLASATIFSAHADSADVSGFDNRDFVLKARLGYLAASNKINNSSTVTHKFKNGYTGDVALNYFFTENIAVEGSVGYARSKLDRTASGNNKSKQITFVPLTLLAQYNFMPGAKVSPYVGIGYSYQFVTGGPSGSKVKDGGGITGQIGADIPMNNTFGFNVDVKHTYKAKHNITYSGTKYKGKLSTTTVMAGVAFPL